MFEECGVCDLLIVLFIVCCYVWFLFGLFLIIWIVLFVGFGNCGVWFVYVSYGFDCLLYFGVGCLNLDWLYVVCLLVDYCACGFIVWCLFVVWLVSVGWFTWLFVCLMIFGCVLVCACWVCLGFCIVFFGSGLIDCC